MLFPLRNRRLKHFLIILPALFFFLFKDVKAELNLGARNNSFVGREPYFQKIQELLKNQNHVLLFGLPGVGKTQIAREYAHRNIGSYDHIFWFSDNGLLEQRLHELMKFYSQSKNLPYTQQASKNSQINLFCSTMSDSDDEILFIFDDYNINSPEVKCLLGPKTNKGKNLHVIVTSNQSKADQMIQVTPLQRNESLNLLGKFLKHESPGSLNILCEVLGDYPLALVQAASFLITNQTLTIEKYVKLFKDNRGELYSAEQKIVEGGEGDTRPVDTYKKTIQNVLNITINELEKKNPLALRMLEVISFLDNTEVPQRLLEKWAAANNITDIEFHSALSQLLGYSLIFSSQSNGNYKDSQALYDKYGLINDIIYHRMSEEKKKENIQYLINAFIDNLETNKVTLKSKFFSEEYLGKHAEKLYKIAKEINYINREVLDLKIYLMYYYHFILRDFDQSSMLINEIENDINLTKPSLLAEIIYHLTLTNNEAYLNWEKSQAHSQKAIELCLNLKTYDLREEYEAEILTSLMMGLINFGLLEQALEIKDLLFEKSQNVQNKFTKLLAILMATESSIVNAKYKEALKLISLNESLIEENKDLEKYASVIAVQKAEAYLGNCNYQEAIDLSSRCIKNLKNTFTTTLNHEYIKAVAINSEGLLRIGKLDVALDNILPLTNQLSSDVHYEKDSLKGKIFSILGQILEEKGDLLGALKAYKESEVHYESILQSSRPEELSWLYEKISRAFLELGDEIEAKKYLTKHIERFGINHKRSISINQFL